MELFTGTKRDSDSPQAAPARLINFYRELSGDRTGYILKSVLGTEAFADVATVFMRAMEEVEGQIYCVAGGFLFNVSQSGNVTNLGAITDSEETTISGNNGSVTVVAGGAYYVWDGSTLSQPATGAFSNMGSVEFVGQRTILTERNGRRVQWSDPADATTLGGSYKTTETSDDKNIRCMVVAGNLWIFKEKHTEIWQLTASTDIFAWAVTLETGLKSFGLAAKFPNGAGIVGNDGIVYTTNGAGLRPISTTAVETDIKESNPTRAFYYEDKGHKFFVIRFDDRPAWCYDISTGEWHERAEGTDLGAWQTVAAVKAYGDWHAGSDLGSVYKLSRVNTDVSGPLLCRAVSRTLRNGTARFNIDKMEAFAEMGQADYSRAVSGDNYVVTGYVADDYVSGASAATQVDLDFWVRVSKDGGKTFGTEKWRSFGKLGEYSNRATFRAMGQSRSFVFELNKSAPVDVPIYCDWDIQ